MENSTEMNLTIAAKALGIDKELAARIASQILLVYSRERMLDPTVRLELTFRDAWKTPKVYHLTPIDKKK